VNRASVLGSQNVRFTATETAPLALTWYSRNQLYRIVQEALHNAVVHSDAKTIDVTLVTDLRTVRVTVADDGRGRSSRATALGGFGIETMRHRAASLQARLRIEPRPSGGTIVICDCPHAIVEPPGGGMRAHAVPG
jgi:signal transduction histidine kinase